jgi:phosphatidylglycerophosphate synthase
MRRRITVREVKNVCHKPGAHLCLFRRLSYYITIPILHTSLTPNQITWIWVILGIGSAGLFYPGTYWWSLAGALLGAFAFLLDHVDGCVARYKKMYSQKGYYVDEIGTFVLMGAILFMIGFGGWQKTGQIFWIFAGALSMLAYLIYQLNIIFMKLKIDTGAKLTTAADKNPKLHKKVNLLKKLLPAHLDEVFYLMIVLALFGIVEWTLIYVGTVYLGMFIGKFAYDYKHSFEN